MFLPTLEGQCNEEQRKLFLEPALRHEIIGCYAQTEVKHYLWGKGGMDMNMFLFFY